MSQLDLNLLPLLRQDGQEPAAYPGIYMVTPPKRTARGREDDRLVLYFTEQGNAPIGSEATTQILGKLTHAYYRASGSLTAALRTTAEMMNQFLLERNLKSSSAGRQCVGLLALLVLREQRMTVGLCGPLRGWLVTPQATDEWFDPQASGRGLGLARAVSIRFFQAEAVPNSYLILSAQPPAAWAVSSLMSAHTQGIESLRRKLLAQAGDDFSAIVIQPQAGMGKIRLLRVRPPAQMVKGSEPPAATGAAVEPVEPDKGAGVGTAPQEALPEETHEETPVIVPPEPDVEAQPEPPTPADEPLTGEQVPAPDAIGPEPAVSSQDAPRAAVTPGKPPRPAASTGNAAPAQKKPRPVAAPKPKKSLDWSPVTRVTAPLGKAVGGAFRAVAGGLGKLLKRLLPDETLFTLPGATMAMIAVAIALVMAAAGFAVYNRNGRAAEFQKYYDQAILHAEAALNTDDPDEQRISWETTLAYLDKAEDRLATQESQSLRANALAELDQLDAIIRLQYEPALPGPLSASVVITKIVADGADLFLLNATGGDVIHARKLANSYEMDPSFDCGPNPLIGNILDIAILPCSTSDAPAVTLLALDDRHQLIKCSPDSDSVVNTPAAPHLGWIDPIAFTVNSGSLYVLDPANRAVWIYPAMKTADLPHLFFAEDVPNDMGNAIDLEVVDGRLFLLHQDGHIARCIYGDPEISPTTCQDPLSFDDSRPGRNDMPVILDAHFDQLSFAPPPNPSLFMLDPLRQSVYNFSLQLAVQGQYRPASSLGENEATAFAITTDRQILLAIGSQLYRAIIP